MTERTFVMVKPDGVMRGLTGEIVRRIEQRGLKVVGLKMFQPTREQIDGHYPKDEAWITRLGEKSKSTYDKYNLNMQELLGTTETKAVGEMVRGWIIDFMVSGPVVTMVVEGVHAIDMARKLAGNTIPAFADVGTIRGDFSVDSPAAANSEKRSLANLVHASENPGEAEHEIGYWFKAEEIVSYRRNDAESPF